MAAALAALGTLGALGLPERALACGALEYQQELQTNADGSVVAGSLGLNLLVVGSIDGLSAKLYRLTEGEPLEIVVDVSSEQLSGDFVRLTLAEAIAAGAEYRLVVEDTSEGQAGSKEYTFLGVEAPARPETIALSVSAPKLGIAVAGGCGELYEPGKQTLLHLTETDALTAWERGVRHQLLLDGEPAFRGEVPLIDFVRGLPQAPVVRALADCSKPDFEDSELLSATGVLLTLEPKQYRAQWQLSFPDGTQLLSDEQPLDLRCQADDEEPAPEPPQTGDGDNDNDSGAEKPAGSTAGSGACAVGPGQASGAGSLWGLALAACAFMLARRKAG